MALERLLHRSDGTEHANFTWSILHLQVFASPKDFQCIPLESIERASLGFAQFVHARQMVGDIGNWLFVFEETDEFKVLNHPALASFDFRHFRESVRLKA